MPMIKYKTEPHYSFSFRYKEEVRKGIETIRKHNKVKGKLMAQNKAVELAILTVAKTLSV